MRKLRILLADDHETVREGLKAILNAQSDMEVIGEATDGEAAVTRRARSIRTSSSSTSRCRGSTAEGHGADTRVLSHG